MTRNFLTLSLWALTLSVINQPATGQSPTFALLVFPDASVAIKNLSNTPRAVSAYVIESDTSNLVVDEWFSIHRQFSTDPDFVRSLLGPDFPKPGLPFAEFSPIGPAALGEALPLPLWEPNVQVPIGKPLGDDLDLIRSWIADGSLTWALEDGTEGGYPIILIPEPFTLVLSLIAAPLLLPRFTKSLRARAVR